jgi:hypothetical protein
MMGTITTPPVNMSQRVIMQYLSLDEWKIVSRLPVPAGQVMLDRMHAFGWIERRGSKSLAEIRLTLSGLEAMRAQL